MKQINHFKRKIRAHFENASDEQYTSGLHWYREARKFCLGISEQYDVPLIKVIGILAALSPNNRWARNKIDLELFLENPSVKTKVCTFMGQREKAVRIYFMHNPHAYIQDALCIKEILNGTKTKNFFENILDHKTSRQVTVDVWAFRSCGVDEKTKYINDITLAYQEVAEELDLRPHQLQAVCWAVVRGSHA